MFLAVPQLFQFATALLAEGEQREDAEGNDRRDDRTDQAGTAEGGRGDVENALARVGRLTPARLLGPTQHWKP